MDFGKWRHFCRARLFDLLKMPDSAIAEYRLALEADPQFRKAANSLAYRYAQSGRSREAIECFDRVLALDASDPYAHYNLGYVCAQQGDQRRAIEHFRAATGLRPKMDVAWYGQGLAHATLGEHRQAMEAFNHAALLQPMSGPVWYQLGMACHHAREPERVREIIHHLNRFDRKLARRLIQESGSTDLAHLVQDLNV